MRAVTLLISALLCANSQAYSAESCKIDGKKAVEVMQFRQGSEDLFAALEKYNDVDMVMSAFERPRYDSMKSLTAMVDGISNRDYNALAVRHDEVVEKKQNEINLFKIKYIKICLSNITNKKATN
tara:strand:- start:86 stop:460 length:375 start_codon:yes stop_codon:yes gene_type:complete